MVYDFLHVTVNKLCEFQFFQIFISKGRSRFKGRLKIFGNRIEFHFLPWNLRCSDFSNAFFTQISKEPFPCYILNNSFLPVLINPSQEIDAWRQIENDFFNSLNNLSALYGFEKMDVSGKVYPYNIAVSFAHAAACMKVLQPDLSVVIIQHGLHAATIATVKTFNTRSTLYFINVKPLHELLKNKKRKRVATLLQSVFTYLYKMAGVTYYTDNNKYLYYSYENISNWLTDESNELEQPQFEENQAKIELCFDVGRTVHKKIKNISLLLSLKKRNKNFKPSADGKKICCKSVSVSKS